MAFFPQFFLFVLVCPYFVPVCPFFPCLPLFVPCSIRVLEQPQLISNSPGYIKSVYDTIFLESKITSVCCSQSVSVSTFLAKRDNFDRVFPLWEFVLIDVTRYWAKTLNKYFQTQRAEYKKRSQKRENFGNKETYFLTFFFFNM